MYILANSTRRNYRCKVANDKLNKVPIMERRVHRFQQYIRVGFCRNLIVAFCCDGFQVKRLSSVVIDQQRRKVAGIIERNIAFTNFSVIIRIPVYIQIVLGISNIANRTDLAGSIFRNFYFQGKRKFGRTEFLPGNHCGLNIGDVEIETINFKLKIGIIN